MEFVRVMERIKKNVDYYSRDVERKCGIEADDAKQELLLRCFLEKDKYDKNRGQENTFFITVVKNSARSMIKKEYRQKRINLKCLYLSDCYFTSKNDESGKTEKHSWYNTILLSDVDFENRVITMQLLNGIKEKLEGNSKVVFEKLMQNEEINDIAESLEISSQGVHNIIRRKIRPLIDLEF